jgi:hypothetical protein
MTGDKSTSDIEREPIFENGYLRVTDHDGQRVLVQTGVQPEKETPSLVNARKLRDALSSHLDDVDEGSETLSLVDIESGHQLLSADVVDWIDDETAVVEDVIANPHTDFWERDSDD